MNELRKYATFSIDMTGTPVRVNSMFSIGRARIFYMGPNPNRSIIEGDVAYKLASTIPGTPIIGLYNYDTEDFEGHGDGQTAFGFVPLEPNSKWVKINEDGKEKEYLEVDVVIWDGRFEEAKSILSDEKSLSMELNPATLKGTIVKIGDHAYYKIVNAEFAGITVLGEDVEPCFKDAKFLQAYSNMVSAYASYVTDIQKNEEGGISKMENNEEIIVEVEEVVEPELNTEEEAEEKTEEISEEEIIEEKTAEPEKTEEEVTEEATEEAEKEAEPETEAVEETEEAPTEENFEAKEDDEEVCPLCGEEPCICENECKEEEKTYSEEEYNALQAENESLKEELNAAQEALKIYTRNEKLEIINKFSTKLESEEVIANLTERVDDLSKEEIKSELGIALAEQIANEEQAEEDEEEVENNFSLKLDANKEVRNDAWGLVDNYLKRK